MLTHTPLSIEGTAALLGPPLFAETADYAARRNGVSPIDAERQVVECLRYLYLMSSHRERLNGSFLPVEQAIDEVWHYLILQTREYRRLCEVCLPGAFFIEHRSLPYASYQQASPREQRVKEALGWLPLYHDVFGPFDAQALRYWTMARFLQDEMGMSLAEIAALCTETAT